VTLLAYQQALCDLVASPALCVAVRRDPERSLLKFDLTERERRRLAAVAGQRGMSTSCTLHRVNRITPIFEYLPLTCALLGDDLIREAELFWDEGAASDLQFGPESERFAEFLKRRVRTGAVADPYLEDVVEFELTANRFRARLREEDPGDGRLVATTTFRHEPTELLAALIDGRRPDREPARGEFVVTLDASGGELAIARVEHTCA
jgi:hypothetical protein